MHPEHILSDRSGATGQAEATRFGDFVFVRTQLGWGSDDAIERPGNFVAQFDRAFENLDGVLHQVGGSLMDVVRIRYPFVDGRNYVDCRRARHRIWPDKGPPATVVVGYGHADKLALGGVEAIAYLGADREVVEWSPEFARRDNTPGYSPEIRGKVGFSPATRAGHLAFLAGQVALDEKDDYVALGQPLEQTRYSHDNNLRVLEQMGLAPTAAVKFFNFITYPHYAEQVAEVTGQYFPQHAPSSTIVAALGWPGNIIESEITATVGVEPHYLPTKPFVSDPGTSSAVRVGNIVFTAGIVSRDADGSVVGHGDARAQLDQIFANLAEVLYEGGTNPSNLLMMNVYLAANTLFETWEDARIRFQKEYLASEAPFPACSVYAVSALPSYQTLAQVEAIAGSA